MHCLRLFVLPLSSSTLVQTRSMRKRLIQQRMVEQGRTGGAGGGREDGRVMHPTNMDYIGREGWHYLNASSDLGKYSLNIKRGGEINIHVILEFHIR